MTGRLIITRGLPASGKTTWALNQIHTAEPGSVARVNRDDYRRMLHGRAHYDPIHEHAVTIAQHSAVRALLADGITVIVDDTNLPKPHVDALVLCAARVGVGYRIKDFRHVPVDTCVTRDAARPDSTRVGAEVIRRMYRLHIATD